MTTQLDPSRKKAWYQVPVFWMVISLLAIPLVSPLLRWLTVPCTHDGHLHYHRIAAMRYALENGVWFSRWLPDVAFGYGYPFFNYREALPLYFGLFPHLVGIPLPAALNLFYGLTIVAAGWFMFLWVRDLFGAPAGLISALVYMAAPYVLIDALIRGNQPESLALAIFPLLGWASRRFLLTGRAGHFVLAALGITALALGHNISIFLFVPFLLVYLIAVGIWRELAWRTVAWRLLALFGIGLGLSAFYLVPALLELDQISIIQSVNRRGNDFHFNFASLAEIMAPVSPANPSLLNPPLLIRLGWVPIILSVLGLVSVLWTRGKERRGHIFFMALAASVLLFMALPLSEGLWERLPLIEFVQFPWRFIGRAALPLAFLAGVPFGVWLQSSKLGSHHARWIVPTFFGLTVLLVLIEATPMLYPAECKEEAAPTINTVHAYEHNTGLVGVDPAGSYFPKTVGQMPIDSPLEADYQAGLMPKRFDFSSLPTSATVLSEGYDGLAATATIDSPEAFQMRYFTFDFPGWTVTVDGHPVPSEASDPEGLITFQVPAGEHSIRVRWQQTSIRKIATILSLSSLMGMVVVGYVLVQRQTGQDADSERLQGKKDDSKRNLSRGVLISVGIVALTWLLLKLLVIDQIETPFKKNAPPFVDYPVALTAAELKLAGFNIDSDSVVSGGTFDVDLAWQTLSPPVGDYQSNVWLVDPNGVIWSDKETARPRSYEDVVPTSQWQPGQWAWDSREVQVFPGTPPGLYDLTLVLFDRNTLQPLTIMGPGGVVVGPEAVIGQIEVTHPSNPPIFMPQVELATTIAGLNLLGFNLDRKEASPGEQFLLSLFWEKPGAATVPAENLDLMLRDSGGNIVQSWSIPPVRSDYPASDWLTGERLLGQHRLRLQADLDSGPYQFDLESTPLGELIVNAPGRIFKEPDYSQPVGASFSDQINLTGMTVLPENPLPDSPLTITLVWQALAETETSYRVFIHLLDENDQIVVQSDAEPAKWMRPTSGWVVGEYIVDAHDFQIPVGVEPENLRARIGLYDPLSGIRVPVAGSDSIVLPLLDSRATR